MTSNAQVQEYFDALIASYDLLAEASKRASERGVKLSQQVAEDIGSGQREALELAKKASQDPSDMASAAAAALEATIAAQGRALKLAEIAYEEAVAANADARQLMADLLAANRSVAESAASLSQAWLAESPLTKMWSQSFGAEAPQARRKAAAKR